MVGKVYWLFKVLGQRNPQAQVVAIVSESDLNAVDARMVTLRLTVSFSRSNTLL